MEITIDKDFVIDTEEIWTTWEEITFSWINYTDGKRLDSISIMSETDYVVKTHDDNELSILWGESLEIGGGKMNLSFFIKWTTATQAFTFLIKR